MTGYSQADAYWERGWVPLPLPHGQKKTPPEGTTGATAREVSYSDVASWMEEHPDGNIAVRMPQNVIGLDIDAYKDVCASTMNELVKLAPMPATWRSSSRGQENPSGIYFYRIPDGVDPATLRDPLPGPLATSKGSGAGGVESIRPGHRYAVVAPSLAPPPPVGSGQTYAWYDPTGAPSDPPRVDDLPIFPAEWLPRLQRVQQNTVDFDTRQADAAKPTEAGAYEVAAVKGVVDRLDAMRDGATPNPHNYRGEPWDATTYYAACRLLEIANGSWSALTRERAVELVLEHAPRDAGFDEARIREKILSASRSVGDKAAPAPAPRTGDGGLVALAGGAAPRLASQPATDGPVRIDGDLKVDVTSKALAATWLREELGRGRLSGVFLRRDNLVYTPRIGEEGYIEPKRDVEIQSPASFAPMTEHELQARIQARYTVVQMVPDQAATAKARKLDEEAGVVFKEKPAIFPLESAKVVVRACDEAWNLRNLNGVIHAPLLRADGTLLDQPGYDVATQLLFLPIGRQPAPIPAEPTDEHLAIARSWIDYMLQDFQFVTVHDRATYIGLMLTPLLRNIVPPPYKMGVIEAHQPGSGKSFLARALTSIHGGVMHAELPSIEDEINKLVATILDTQTAPVVAFDNVTGVVKSPTLAGLLTSPTFMARRLGSSTSIEAINDRMWLITGNNASLGGDLHRRSVHVRIDPGVPNPELRTGFAISDFESWVREHRPDLLWSLLVLVRRWAAAGMPLLEAPTGDSYGRWVAVVRSILTLAGVPGSFGEVSPDVEILTDPDSEEWENFLTTIHQRFGTTPWTVKDLLRQVAHPAFSGVDPTRPIPHDCLPSSLLAAGRGAGDPSMLGTSLGRFLLNRRGRWFGRYSLVRHSKTDKGVLWTIRVYGS